MPLTRFDFRHVGPAQGCLWRHRYCVPVTRVLFLPVLVPRLRWKHSSSLKVANEPILAFTQGSAERDALQKVRV